MSIKSLYPDIRPSLNLDFANSKALDSRITFTRDSTATYVGANGLIQTTQRNAPRFDHDPVTGESLGFLIEEQRTNRFSNSTTYAGTGWNLQSANGVTTNTTDIVAPDGSLTATKWQPTTSTVQYIYAGTDGALGTSTYTMSVWVRTPTGESTTFSMNLYAPSQSPGAAAFTATDTWQRFSWTFIAQNQSTAYPVVVEQLNKILYIWGPQIELGSFPTSYIPTSGSAVTRAVDQAYILGDNVPLGSGVDEYSFYVRGRLLDTANYSGISRGLVGMGSSTSERIRIPHNNAGFVEVYSGGSAQAQLFTGDIGTTERQIALAVKKDDFAMCMDGGTVQTDTSGNIPSSIDNISLGTSTYDDPPITYPSTSYIKEFRIYPKRLTNAQLQLLTQ